MTAKDEFMDIAKEKGFTQQNLQSWRERVNLKDFVKELNSDQEFKDSFKAAVDEAEEGSTGLSMLFPDS